MNYLTFSFIGCGVCIDEMKRVESLKSRLDRYPDIVLLYILVDEPEDKSKWVVALKSTSF